MIDAFTAATGIAGLLSLTMEISKMMHGQVSAMKNAPKNAEALLQEIDQMQRVLTNLEGFLRSDDAKYSLFSEASVLILASNGFSKDIKELKGKIQKLCNERGFSRVVGRGKWYFREEEHREVVSTLRRYLGMFQ